MLDNKYCSAFANLVLAVSSVWAINELKENHYSFVHGAMFLHLALGVLGVLALLASLVEIGENEIARAHRFISNLATIFCFPLVAGQLYSNTGHHLASLAHVGSAAIILACQLTDQGREDFLDIMLVANMASVAVLSVVYKLGVFALAMTACYAVAYLAVGTNGTKMDMPAIDLFLYFMSLFNWLAIKALK